MRGLLASVAWVGLLACATPERAQPETFDSQRLVILMGGMRMQAGQPAITVALKNKTAAPIWVAATFSAPDGGQDCAYFERIDPTAHHTFACPQTELLYDQTYAVSFDAFADAERQRPLEQQSTEFLFGSELRALMQAAGR